MDMNPKVSVIIPVYNVEKYLRQCLDSVVNQTLRDIEIICVDDGSTDTSLEILREYQSKDSRIMVLHQENINAGAARNHGLKYAHGKYLSFLDSDDFFELDMLEKAYNAAENNSLEIVVFRSDHYMQATKKFEAISWSIRKDLLPHKEIFSFREIEKNRLKCFVGWAWDKLFLHDFISKNNLQFQEQRTTNDMYFVFAALIKAKRIGVLEDILAHQRKLTTGTLSVTREKSWDCFYFALLKVREQIKQWDDWDWMEQDFINYAVHAIMWNYSTLSETVKERFYNKVRDEWAQELGILEFDYQYFYNLHEYQAVMNIVTKSYASYYHQIPENTVEKVDIGMNPKVSVVMPSLNVRPYIVECIESALHQSLQNIEIICVDAGSTDGTLEILKEYAQKDQRVKVIESDKKSYGYQMNLGLKAARGEYFAILETDDYIEPDMYEVLTKIADENQLDVIKADFCIFVGEGEKRIFTYRPMLTEKKFYNQVVDPSEDFRFFKANNVSWAGIYNLNFLRSNHILHNETPGASYQDNGFWFQVFSNAHRIWFYNHPFYMLRRDNPNSSVLSKGKVYCMCDEYDFIRNILRKDPEKEKKFAPLCAYYRHNNYNWTLNRIADEYKLEFLKRYSDDFKKIQEAGEIDPKLFKKHQWIRLMNIINNPVGYYKKHFSYNAQTTTSINNEMNVLADDDIAVLRQKLARANNQIAFLKREIDNIHHSWTYRIGRIITWLPRKIRGGIRCYQEHGLSYTVNRLLIHLHLKSEYGKRHSNLSDNTAVTTKKQSVHEPKRDYNYYNMLPPEKYEDELKVWFKKVTGDELNLNQPLTYNAKIQWLKLYDSTPLKTKLADKYLVRNWVEEKIGAQYLIPLLGVWDKFDDIDFDKLPNSFVLKANHGCGWNIIVKDKSKFDIEDARKKFNTWMSTNFAFKFGLELQYLNIAPKIIAEQYLENGANDLYDYKVFCFNGKAESIMFLSERKQGLKMAFYDLNWNKLPFVYTYPRNEAEVPKPQNLELLIKLSEKLAEGFAHVRVDFYILNDGSLKFGEMTFTSASGSCKWNPPEQDRIYGDLIKLPPKSPIPERKVF